MILLNKLQIIHNFFSLCASRTYALYMSTLRKCSWIGFMNFLISSTSLSVTSNCVYVGP